MRSIRWSPSSAAAGTSSWPAFNDIPGITCLEPQGAFYAFPDITETGQTSAGLQARLLADAGVAALSGTAFGPFGEGFLRFFLRRNSVENIRLALEAIRAQLS